MGDVTRGRPGSASPGVRRWRWAALAGAFVAFFGFFEGTASALVAIAPATYVPYLTGTDNYVYAGDDVGGRTYVGGIITKVYAPYNHGTYTRSSLFSFTDGTGALSTFAPTFDGPVWGIAHSSDGKYLYVAGQFSHVNGIGMRNLAKFVIATGALDTGFNAHLNGMAQYVAYQAGRVVVGGYFTSAGGAAHTGLAALNPTTGADTKYINISMSGTVASNAGSTGVRRFAINPAGTRLVAIGNFTTVGGVSHWRAFMLDLGSTSATLDAWNAPILQHPCVSSEPKYLWDVKFSPDGSYFVFVSQGYFGSGSVFSNICDAVARFETNSSANATYTWANYTGGDSLYAVAVTSDAVYVAGHQRWLNNPYGRDSAGSGAVSRPGIGAVSTTTGKALSWNPTRSRGAGAKLLFMTSKGLLVGSDCAPAGITGDVSSGANNYNYKYHPCLALAPGV